MCIHRRSMWWQRFILNPFVWKLELKLMVSSLKAVITSVLFRNGSLHTTMNEMFQIICTFVLFEEMFLDYFMSYFVNHTCLGWPSGIPLSFCKCWLIIFKGLCEIWVMGYVSYNYYTIFCTTRNILKGTLWWFSK